MTNIFISLFSIYFFIIVGYLIKQIHKEKINEYTLTIISIYSLSPIMVFWGFMLRPIDKELLLAPMLFLGISLIAFIFLYLFSKTQSLEPKQKSILLASPLIGNTGNIGIPLCIMLLGEVSIPYTNAINLINIFMVYIIGVYFYSRGTFSVKDSILNILKMPVLWSAILALVLNISSIKLSNNMMKALEMGAYSSMAIQLILFGIYLHSANLKSFSKPLMVRVFLFKFLFIPLLALLILSFLKVPEIIYYIVFIELAVPLAITNATLATLYDCKPQEVTAQIFYSTLFFVPYFMFIAWIFDIKNL